MLETTQRQLLKGLQKEPVLVKRLELFAQDCEGGRGDSAELGAGDLRPAAICFDFPRPLRSC
jgi:hypothetical protein